MTRGRPRRFPLAFALRIPAFTRSTIRFLSSSATAPRTVKTIFPEGVVVSICSERLTKAIPRALKVSSEIPIAPSCRTSNTPRHQNGAYARLTSTGLMRDGILSSQTRPYQRILQKCKYFPFGESRRLDLVAEFFNLFNSANVPQINPVFGSGLTPMPGFRQPTAGTGARQIQFSLDFEF